MNTPMATRAASGFSTLRPPASAFLSLRFFHLRPSALHGCQIYSSRLPPFRSDKLLFRRHGDPKTCYVHSLVDSVMEELQAIRAMRRAQATSKMGMPTSKELFEVKLQKKTLQKGLLLEFRKDSQKLLLAVAQKPDGKKNWMVYDQVLLETTTAAC